MENNEVTKQDVINGNYKLPAPNNTLYIQTDKGVIEVVNEVYKWVIFAPKYKGDFKDRYMHKGVLRASLENIMKNDDNF